MNEIEDYLFPNFTRKLPIFGNFDFKVYYKGKLVMDSTQKLREWEVKELQLWITYLKTDL